MDSYLQKLINGSSAKKVEEPSGRASNVVDFRSAVENVHASNQSADIRAAATVILERMQFLRQAGITFNGARDLYDILGYDRLITNRQYRDRYARGGISGRIIDVMPNATWRGEMWVEEDKDPDTLTKFESDWEKIAQKHQVIAKFRRVDILSGLSTYAVLLVGAAGRLDEELPRVPQGSVDKLLYLSAFSGGGGPGGDINSRAIALDADCTIETFETNPENPRFGLPLTYRLKRTDLTSPELQRPVHWTRIIHVAENCIHDEVYGQPGLERVWNLLDDLDKVTGGGAEAFWLRANQGLHLNIDKDMALPDTKVAIDALKAQSEDYKNQLTRWLRTRGVDVKTLGSDVANFSSPADAVLTQIAGSKAIPKRLLTGSEMGELASSQDRENFKDQVNGRQTQYAGPYIVRQLVDRLIQYGYVSAPQKGPDVYEVKWPHVQTLTEQEKADGAQKWATTNHTQGSPVFTDDEIRDKWYGLAPLTDEQKQKIADEAAKKLADAQAAMKGSVPEEPLPGEPRAAENAELLEVLLEAIRSNNTQVIDRILGLEHEL